jgi:hypothetical protein
MIGPGPNTDFYGQRERFFWQANRQATLFNNDF